MRRGQQTKILVSIQMMAALLTFITPARAATESDITRATLKNGFRVILVRNTLAPVVATSTKLPRRFERRAHGFPGMAHALEHMMFRGSPGLSSEQLSNLIGAMGGNFNAKHADQSPNTFSRSRQAISRSR